MKSRDLSFSSYHKYSFSRCLSEFGSQLIFKGITYYERYLVFEHLKELQNETFLDFFINKIELIFNVEHLVGLQIYIDEKDLNKVIEILEANLDSDSIKFNYLEDHIISDELRINHYWMDTRFIVAVRGLDKINIYIGLKEFNITIIETNT